MPRGRPSGYQIKQKDVPIILGMSNRGDRDHDIAAWFGVNQGRIAEAKDGHHGPAQPAPQDQLPPAGPPGIKGRRLRDKVGKALTAIASNNFDKIQTILREAVAEYDANET